MAETLGITATICAFFSGSILGGALFNHYRSARLKASMKALLGSSSIVDFINGGEPQNWWKFTAQRKAYLASI